VSGAARSSHRRGGMVAEVAGMANSHAGPATSDGGEKAAARHGRESLVAVRNLSAIIAPG
jgi:hypothetical protein